MNDRKIFDEEFYLGGRAHIALQRGRLWAVERFRDAWLTRRSLTGNIPFMVFVKMMYGEGINMTG